MSNFEEHSFQRINLLNSVRVNFAFCKNIRSLLFKNAVQLTGAQLRSISIPDKDDQCRGHYIRSWEKKILFEGSLIPHTFSSSTSLTAGVTAPFLQSW